MSDEEDRKESALATLATRGFVGAPAPTIAGATAAGLLALAVTIWIDAPLAVNFVALFAGILLVLGLRAGAVDCRLTTDGIERTVQPMLARMLRRGARRQHLAFADMRWYRRGRDRSRYRGEIAFLKLGLRRLPFRVAIHSIGNAAGFTAFADSFEAELRRQNLPIREARDFYGTVWAKLLTVAFALAGGALVVLFLAGRLEGTQVFRLLVIIVPGVLYMAYRTFLRPRETA